MKVLCLGGGPAGLYFAISMKLRNPSHQVTLLERNRPDDTFGWGVVLSDETLANMAANDPQSEEVIRGHFAYWDDVAVVHKGVRTVSSGHGFCGIGRKQLLLDLQARAREIGVDLQFETPAKPAAAHGRSGFPRRQARHPLFNLRAARRHEGSQKAPDQPPVEDRPDGLAADQPQRRQSLVFGAL